MKEEKVPMGPITQPLTVKTNKNKFEFKSWWGGLLVFLAIFLFFAITKPVFFSSVNILRNIILPAGIAGVIALGMTIVMAGGGIDLSVGAISGLSALIAGSIATNIHISVPLIMLIAMLTGLLIGGLNGFFVSFLSVNPFVVTLSSVFLIRGLEYLFTLRLVSGTYIMMPEELTRAGSSTWFQMGLFVLTSVLLYVFLDHTRFGRSIHSVGENLQVTHYSGLPIKLYTWLTYALCGVLVAIGGVMLTSYEGMVKVGTGESYLIDAFVLPILGQAVFKRISVEGTLFGALLIFMVINGLFIYGTPPIYVNFVKGGLLLVVIILSGIQKLRES
jgi:ribose/xylose/arabinose/galactoside ABC-type transport system permease subunit